MSARTRGASAAAGAVTARCASARPRSQTRLAARVAEPPRPPLGSHDLVHRLASAGGDSITDSPRGAARVAEPPRPPLGSHDLVHRLASAGGDSITDSPRGAARVAEPPRPPLGSRDALLGSPPPAGAPAPRRRRPP